VKKVMWLFALATFFGGLVYTVISLNRWEWNRALFFGLVMVVAEVGLGTGLVLRKLDRMEESAEQRERTEVKGVLQDTRVAPHRFEWLAPEEVVSRSNVFITMLVGGGVVLSGLAWVLDKLAARTTTSLEEGRLAGDLTRISYPQDGLLPDEITVLAQSVPHFDDPKLRALLRRER
jgi:hypothetical protein